MTAPPEFGAAIEVTQADRDAAAAFCGRPHFRNGTDYDHNPLVQAFARHRTSTALPLAQPAAVEVGELQRHVASLRALSRFLIGNDIDMRLPDDVDFDPADTADILAALAPAAIASGREGA